MTRYCIKTPGNCFLKVKTKHNFMSWQPCVCRNHAEWQDKCQMNRSRNVTPNNVSIRAQTNHQDVIIITQGMWNGNRGQMWVIFNMLNAEKQPDAGKWPTQIETIVPSTSIIVRHGIQGITIHFGLLRRWWKLFWPIQLRHLTLTLSASRSFRHLQTRPSSLTAKHLAVCQCKGPLEVHSVEICSQRDLF